MRKQIQQSLSALPKGDLKGNWITGRDREHYVSLQAVEANAPGLDPGVEADSL